MESLVPCQNTGFSSFFLHTDATDETFFEGELWNYIFHMQLREYFHVSL